MKLQTVFYIAFWSIYHRMYVKMFSSGCVFKSRAGVVLALYMWWVTVLRLWYFVKSSFFLFEFKSERRNHFQNMTGSKSGIYEENPVIWLVTRLGQMNPRDYPHYYAKRERDNTHFHFSFLVTSKELFILSRKSFFGGFWLLHIQACLNPSHPKINMHLLHTVLHTFPKVLIIRICLTIKSFFNMWSFPLLSEP